MSYLTSPTRFISNSRACGGRPNIRINLSGAAGIVMLRISLLVQEWLSLASEFMYGSESGYFTQTAFELLRADFVRSLFYGYPAARADAFGVIFWSGLYVAGGLN